MRFPTTDRSPRSRAIKHKSASVRDRHVPLGPSGHWSTTACEVGDAFEPAPPGTAHAWSCRFSSVLLLPGGGAWCAVPLVTQRAAGGARVRCFEAGPLWGSHD